MTPKRRFWCAATLPKVQTYEGCPAMQKVTTLYPNHLRSGGLIDRVFDLALDNQTLFRLERSLILRMAHIQQGRYALSRLKALVPASSSEILR